jgi:hypothetical protein
MQGALDGVTVSVIVSGVRRTGTSEKVREQVLCFFLLAKMMAETASLELVASGRAMNEMKKDGMCVALEKLWTVSTSGSANAAAMAAPRRRNPTAFAMHHPGFSTLSTASSDLSISWSCSCLVLSWNSLMNLFEKAPLAGTLRLASLSHFFIPCTNSSSSTASLRDVSKSSMTFSTASILSKSTSSKLIPTMRACSSAWERVRLLSRSILWNSLRVNTRQGS